MIYQHLQKTALATAPEPSKVRNHDKSDFAMKFFLKISWESKPSTKKSGNAPWH